jgi:uridine kinase
MMQQVQALCRGEPIEMPVYDFTLHNRSSKPSPSSPHR